MDIMYLLKLLHNLKEPHENVVRVVFPSEFLEDILPIVQDFVGHKSLAIGPDLSIVAYQTVLEIAAIVVVKSLLFEVPPPIIGLLDVINTF